ncbi:large ribosomal subunit protein mL42 [Phymastichus coffea]|uniref:large ribosomal subunit protein mL42 n=1 Tax=Phymastichus coffea TaxID=108790 RepID=UPI00273AA99D|nr:large ribosomal subunit protein mL42 [Phymastichus coffea]
MFVPGMNLNVRLFRSLYQHSLTRAYGTKLPSELVVFMDDIMVVCWHPEQPFPYKYSKPLPEKQPEPESVLKVGDTEVRKMFRPRRDDLIPEELAKITYTCKHQWYPRARDKKAKKTVPDRPYL